MDRCSPRLNGLHVKPLVVALLVVFPVIDVPYSIAAGLPGTAAPSTAAVADKDALPDLGAVPQQSDLSVRVGPGGVALEGGSDRQKISVAPEYSNQTGMSLGVTLASMLGENAAVAVLLNAGSDKKEWLVNAGYQLDERQRFIVTAGQLKQFLDYAFLSGSEKVGLTQNSGAVSYQLQLGREFLRFLEANGYVAKTASRDLADKTFAVDSATLFELWNDPRRIAGGRVIGIQGKLGLAPIEGSLVKVSFGGEQLKYDLLAGKDSVTRATGGVEWLQELPGRYNLKLSADTFASQNRYSVGIERSLGTSGGDRHNLAVSVDSIQGRDGLGNDTQYKFIYSYVFGTGRSGGGRSAGASATMSANQTGAASRGATDQASLWSGSRLLDQVTVRPSYIPSHIVAKIDTTALPTRLIAVDKTALPTGSTVNAATGDVTVPLGVAVSGIAGVTRNGGAFANGGQFALSGNGLVIRPSQITQPAAGVVDTYVVTINNVAGGTTLATILVSHGSVKIDKVTITSGVAADTTAPVTTVAPAVSGTTATTTALSVTVNENGTGYYLVQPVAAAVPSVAAVQAGTAFALSANVAATPAIAGLVAATAYKIYFVAKDAANNVQTAVQSVAVTTSAATPVPPVMGDVPNQTATVGTAFTLALASSVTITNGDAITAYAIASGTLPTGVTLNTSTGVISGTPTAAGTYNVSVTAADKDGTSNADAIQFVVGAAPVPPMMGASLALVNDSGTSNDYITNDARLTWASVATATAYEVSIDGTNWVDIGNVTNYNFASLSMPQGNNTGYLRAKNAAGVSGVASLGFIYDSLAPTAPSSFSATGTAGAAAGYTANATVSIGLSGSTDAHALRYLVTESASVPAVGAAWAASVSSYTLAGNGVHTLYGWSMDSVGNIQTTPRTLTIDLNTNAVGETGDTVAMTTPGGAGSFTITYNTKIYQASDITTMKFVNDSDGSDAGGSISVASVSGNTVTFNYTAPNLSGTAIKVRTSGKNAYGTSFTNLDSSITTLAAANTAPTANDVSVASADIGFTVTLNLATATISDPNQAASTLSVVVDSTPAHGTLSWTGTTFTFTTAGGYFGDDSFTYHVIDSGGLPSATKTVTLTGLAN